MHNYSHYLDFYDPACRHPFEHKGTAANIAIHSEFCSTARHIFQKDSLKKIPFSYTLLCFSIIYTEQEEQPFQGMKYFAKKPIMTLFQWTIFMDSTGWPQNIKLLTIYYIRFILVSMGKILLIFMLIFSDINIYLLLSQKEKKYFHLA